MTATWNPKKNPLFIDTSALIAILNPRDQYHQNILPFLKASGSSLEGMTTNLVLNELLTFFSRHGNINTVLEFQKQLFSRSEFQVIWIDPPLHLEASKIIKKFKDHRLSFADASSFAVMKKHRLKDALCFDKDFIRAGFRCWPAEISEN